MIDQIIAGAKKKYYEKHIQIHNVAITRLQSRAAN